jgi:hypothetical protein
MNRATKASGGTIRIVIQRPRPVILSLGMVGLAGLEKECSSPRTGRSGAISRETYFWKGSYQAARPVVSASPMASGVVWPPNNFCISAWISTDPDGSP